MDIIYERCAGMDVHKKTVVVCMRIQKGGRCVHEETRTFATMTRNLEELRDWLASQGVTHVAMESTGSYWKPVYNVLEEAFTVLLCNARHVKQVPGRKTDRRDCQWLAELLEHGLLTSSYVPARPQREWRDLTRHRAQLMSEHTRAVNRLQKTLEDANIKLSAVATDLLGVSGRDMLQGLIGGEQDPNALAQRARKQLRGKIPQLREALYGRVRTHHRELLGVLYEHIVYLEQGVADLDTRIETRLHSAELEECAQRTNSVSFARAVALLDTVPGIERTAARAIVAEIGTDMTRFASPGHLASWAGVCPGNNESAGKRRSGKTTPGNRWLKAKLFQCAWAAAHTRHSYRGAAYRRWSRRRGKKKAVVAVSHSMLVSIYRMLEQGVAYADLGADPFDRLQPERLVHYHTRRLAALGYTVSLCASSAHEACPRAAAPPDAASPEAALAVREGPAGAPP